MASLSHDLGILQTDDDVNGDFGKCGNLGRSEQNAPPKGGGRCSAAERTNEFDERTGKNNKNACSFAEQTNIYNHSYAVKLIVYLSNCVCCPLFRLQLTMLAIPIKKNTQYTFFIIDKYTQCVDNEYQDEQQTKGVNVNVEICKIVRKSRTFFFPTINGKRLTKTNFARKYDAQKLINAAFAKYGEAKLEEIFAV